MHKDDATHTHILYSAPLTQVGQLKDNKNHRYTKEMILKRKLRVNGVQNGSNKLAQFTPLESITQPQWLKN